MPASAMLLAVCCLAQFMVVLDVSIVNVALPQMRQALHLSVTGQQWVVNAYTLTFAGFLLLGGRAADLFGRKRIFLLGLGLFTLCSLLGGLAQSGTWLILARAAQGLGGAVLAPATLSVLTTSFPDPEQRRRALGAWSATAASGAAIGVLLGGVLTALLDWRWVLFVNVPIGVLLIATAVPVMAESRDTTTRRSLDLPGAVTVTAGLAVLVYGIVGTDSHPWGSARTLVALGVGAALLAVFAAIETRWAARPLVPFGVFRRRSLSAANGIAVTIGAALFGMYFFLSLYVQQINGYSPLRAGFAFLPVGLATLLGALVAPRLLPYLGARRQLVLGPAVAAGALVWLTTLSPGAGYWGHLFGPLVLSGLGFGLSFVPMTIAATADVPHHEQGLASGLINTTRQVGGALGLAIMATVAAAAAHHAGPRVTAAALTSGYDQAFGIAALVLVMGACLSLFLPSRRPSATLPAPAADGADHHELTDPPVRVDA
ncbi:MAG TPA: MFS transporter [Acidimicrobiales bacterium]|nr:MFS transporter [Acidimicrobiales bacterium]